MAKHTNRYHINKNGVPAACQAKKQMCPLGGDDKHFSTLTEAQQYADKINEKKYNKNMFNNKKQLRAKNDYKSQKKKFNDEIKKVKKTTNPANKRKKYPANKRKKLPSLDELNKMGDGKKITEGTSFSYKDKIKSISVYEKPIQESEFCYHYHVERKGRNNSITEQIGEGTPFIVFQVDDGRRGQYLYEYYDNGKMRVYSLEHKPITVFVPTPGRMRETFEAANVEIPEDYEETVRISSNKMRKLAKEKKKRLKADRKR